MQTTATTVPVFFAVNDAYVPSLAVAIQSLIDHCDGQDTYQLIILNQGLTAENQARLAALATARVTLSFVSLADKLLAQVNDHDNRLRADYFTMTIYYRLFIADMFPELTKAIYLDSDTLVLGDIADLYRTDLHGALLGAVPDPFIANDPKTAAYAEQAVGVPATEYFNSGVLLMDLAGMRKAQFSTHFLALLHEYQFPSIAPDQDYLNAMMHDRLDILPAEWNVQTDGIKAPKVVHYNLFKKPWHYRHVPYEDEFWQYAAESPYLQELEDMRAAFGDDDKQTDDHNMTAMLAKAVRTTTAPGTFGAVQRATGEVRL